MVPEYPKNRPANENEWLHVGFPAWIYDGCMGLWETVLIGIDDRLQWHSMIVCALAEPPSKHQDSESTMHAFVAMGSVDAL